MKKTYIAPQAQAIAIETECPLALSGGKNEDAASDSQISGPNADTGIGNGGSGNDATPAKEYKGWDLWED